MNARALSGIWMTMAVAAVMSYGCASGPRVYTHAASDFSPAAYRSYGFLKNADAQSAGYSTLLTRYIEASIARELQSRGYQPAEQPDLLINFHVVAQDKVQVTSTPTSSAYYGWRRAYAWGGMGYTSEIRSFTEGTLNIDVVDRARKQLVWEGVAVGRVTEQKLKDPERAIDGAVAAIFAHFPADGGRGTTTTSP